MRDELGDLLLHLAFQIVIAKERSQINVGSRHAHARREDLARLPNLFGEGPLRRDDHKTGCEP